MKNYLILLVCFFSSLTIFATHNRAGEILYKRIAPFTNVVGSATLQVYTYSITVIKYSNDGSNIGDRCVDTVYFGDGQKGVAPRINGTFTCNCATNACGEIIAANPNYVVKRNVYSIIHTYSGTGIYEISSSDPNRNSGIHNIPNSNQVPFMIFAQLIIKSNTGANSSPVFNFAPIDQATLNACFTHNPGAVDVDGDSLSFEAIPCSAPGYFDPEGVYGVNALTGLMTWCSPQFIDEYNVAFKVKEWRKNALGSYELNGWIMRDMQILVKSAPVGVLEHASENGISIFPNPFSGNIKIECYSRTAGSKQIKLFSIDGKCLLLENVDENESNIELLTEKIESGVYWIQIISESGIITKKIIKQ